MPLAYSASRAQTVRTSTPAWRLVASRRQSRASAVSEIRGEKSMAGTVERED